MLDTGVRYLSGVGPARSLQLSRLGIMTIGDLLLYPPRAYLDRRVLTPLSDVVPGSEVTVAGSVVSSGIWRSKRGKSVFQAVIEDPSGRIRLSFFNWKFIASTLRPGVSVTASGRIDPFDGGSMVHPEIEVIDPDSDFTPKVLPVYPLTAGITQRYLRRLTARAIEDHSSGMPEILPRSCTESEGWTDRSSVVRSLHYPDDPEEGRRARRLLALEELFLHQLILRSMRETHSGRTGIPMDPDPGIIEDLTASLPYELTDAQLECIGRIRKLMAGTSPMRMLLQGDVGSGKTAVAAAAVAVCCGCGFQSALVAPTEVLAAQHSRSVGRMLQPHGFKVETLTGGTSRSERERILRSLADGGIDLLIGTHAVLEETVVFRELGLCIIDEQHKFGVEQRESLLSSRNPPPHMLIMSATPIPRTLAMTIYGDLESTVIDQMPPGRGTVFSRVWERAMRNTVFNHLKQRLEAGERAYIVYPLREASEESDLLDVSSSFEVLRKGPLGKFGVGMLTGAMKPARKLDVTEKFIRGDISILVSTTVIEVGIDVPEATMMVVVNAERFGLSQLHQLRGRIGRGGRDSWCYLMKGESCGADAAERLAVLESSNDGFEIAGADLRQRGPGEVAGTRQHGLPVFRIASLDADMDLLEEAAGLAADRTPDPSCLEELKWRFPNLASDREG